MTDTPKKRNPRAKGTGSILRGHDSRFWQIAYSSGGKRHYENTKSERKQDARTCQEFCVWGLT